MPSQTQQQKAARARIGNLANPSTVWFWVGYAEGQEGQVGIVRDGDGNQQQGIVTGNIQPRRDAEVSFIPGQPIGAINLATVDSPGGGGGGRLPGADIVIQDNPPADPPNNPKTIWIDRTATTAYAWDAEADTPAWLGPIGSGGTTFDNGDPNFNQVVGAQGDQYVDLDLGRFFVAGPNLAWIPSGPYSFDSSSLAIAEAIYVGDIYQANDGAFYRLDGGGSWILQYVCPDCTEEPDPPPDDGCAAGYGYLQPSGSLYYFRC